MHSYVLRCRMKAALGIEDAFRVFENPNNLARITPPWLNFRIETPGVEMRVGTVIDYKIGWLGLPMRWRTIITEYSPPYRFVDWQARGPYTLWHHTHGFEEVAGGTIVSDEVRYVLPMGALGRLAHTAMVRYQLLGIFRYRQRKLGEMFGGTRELSEPEIIPGSAISKEDLANYGPHQGHRPAPYEQFAK
ncbi:MAG: SRPBCC family protein [Bryobacteraceae bacterium]